MRTDGVETGCLESIWKERVVTETTSSPGTTAARSSSTSAPAGPFWRMSLRGILKDLFLETGTGEVATNEEEIEKVVCRWIDEYRDTGSIKYMPKQYKLNSIRESR